MRIYENDVMSIRNVGFGGLGGTGDFKIRLDLRKYT